MPCHNPILGRCNVGCLVSGNLWVLHQGWGQLLKSRVCNPNGWLNDFHSILENVIGKWSFKKRTPGESRTLKSLRTTVFETAASTIPPPRHDLIITDHSFVIQGGWMHLFKTPLRYFGCISALCSRMSPPRWFRY